MERIKFQELYRLQDDILETIFAGDTEFYLTGGTCLNRFYFEKRYSDDLDLFTNFSDTFAYSAKELIAGLRQSGFTAEKLVDSKDFIRISIVDNDISLQTDLVNDRVKRFGDFRYQRGIRLDNPLNILSNKISAVLARDNPKDIFDIYLISSNCGFSWSDILGQAKEKLHFQKEDLLYRLQSFPVSLLKNLKIIDEHFLDNFEADFAGIILEIQECG